MIIDAHQHFWDPDSGGYDWLVGPYAPIRRVFGPDDLTPELDAAGVAATILVQTKPSLQETRDFLALTQKVRFVAGVVGWVDLTAPEVGRVLDELRRGPGGDRLVGVRHQVHDEPDAEWLLRSDVGRGLAAVAERGLAYDLLVRPRELPAARTVVARFPGLRFVIDHVGKPDIRAGGFAAWAGLLRPFGAHRDHVWCKLSGMVTEADWAGWEPADLAPYVREALEIFGAAKCLFGSDWPVCRVAGGYGRVLTALRSCLAGVSGQDLAWIMSGAARELYHLDNLENLR